MVEVFALYSSFHIAQLQVGLAEPLRLGQARTVKVGHYKETQTFHIPTFRYLFDRYLCQNNCKLRKYV